MRLVADEADLITITLETNNLLILRDSVLRDSVIGDAFIIAKIYEVAICIYQPHCH